MPRWGQNSGSTSAVSSERQRHLGIATIRIPAVPGKNKGLQPVEVTALFRNLVPKGRLATGQGRKPKRLILLSLKNADERQVASFLASFATYTQPNAAIFLIARFPGSNNRFAVCARVSPTYPASETIVNFFPLQQDHTVAITDDNLIARFCWLPI